MLDLNTAEKQRAVGDLIPDGEVVPVHLTLKPGGSGDGGWLKRSARTGCLMLDCEFTVIEGAHAKRKFWTLLTVEGDTEGHHKAADISRSRLRAMLESARGVDPADESAAAMEARRISGWGDLDGLRFVAVVGVEKGKDGYADKNVLKAVVTPDRKGWGRLDQDRRPQAAPVVSAPRPAAVAAPRNGGGRPAWA